MRLFGRPSGTITVASWPRVFYLYMKTIERAHMPNKLWESVKLPRNYEKALELIEKELMYWPKFLVHKAKQRLTKMTQTRIRMRKLALKTREKIMTMPRKETKRESRREQKAEKAALLDKNIEKELIERLHTGVYGDIYNYPFKDYLNVLDNKEQEEPEEEEDVREFVEGYDGLIEEDDMEDFGGFAMDTRNAELEEDEELAATSKTKRRQRISTSASKGSEDDSLVSKSKKRSRVLVEVEHEDNDDRKKMVH